jgi:hypothetical protein
MLSLPKHLPAPALLFIFCHTFCTHPSVRLSRSFVPQPLAIRPLLTHSKKTLHVIYPHPYREPPPPFRFRPALSLSKCARKKTSPLHLT